MGVRTLRTCPKGHQYYKGSDCPTCPICAEGSKPTKGFLSKLASPARNTLVFNGIETAKKLSEYTEKEIMNLHGMGPKSLPTLRQVLEDEGLSFRK